MRDSKHTLSPETVLDVRPRYLIFKIRNPDYNDDDKDIYYIGPYPRPLANYIRLRMLHHKGEVEWACDYYWVVSTKKMKGKYRRYQNPYPMEGIRLDLSNVIAYWSRICYLLDAVGIPEDLPKGPALEDEGYWGYLRFSKGDLAYHLGPHPIPVLRAIRKYLMVLDLQLVETLSNNRRIMIPLSIYRNPQLDSTLDTSVTYEMVQDFSKERLLMYHTLYNLTIPFTSMEDIAV